MKISLDSPSREYAGFFLSSLALLGLGSLIARTYHPAVLSFAELSAPFVERTHSMLAPEPLERFIFISLVLSLPFIAWAFVLLVEWLSWESQKGALLLGAAFSFFFILFQIGSNPSLMPLLMGRFQEPKWMALGLLLTLVAVTSMVRLPERFFPAPESPIRRLSFWLILLILVFSALAFRVIGLSSRSIDLHTDTVLFSLAQVVGGKTALADFPAQYGLYSEMLYPIFKLIPLRLATFSLTMTLIQIASQLLLLSGLIQVFRFRSLATLHALAVVGLTTALALNFTVTMTPYFQYWPIRFAFPACSVWLFVRCKKIWTTDQAILAAAFSAMAILWNIDSGIPVAGSFMAYLLARSFFAKTTFERRTWGAKILVYGTALTVTLLIFSAYLRLKAGAPIDWAGFLKYQLIFYRAGLAMLPMPSPFFHIWMLVVGTYVFGIVSSFTRWRLNQEDDQSHLTFFLSVLGIGLFSYYQGRSHDFNLILVLWPAFAVLLLHADRLLSDARHGRIKMAEGSFAVLPIFFCGLCAVSTVHRLPTIVVIARENFRAALHDLPCELSQTIQFVKNNTLGEKEAVVLSLEQQGIILAETGLVSPLHGPGEQETLLQADLHQKLGDLLAHPVRHIFIPISGGPLSKTQFDRLLTRYRIVERSAPWIGEHASKDGAYAHLVPQQP